MTAASFAHWSPVPGVAGPVVSGDLASMRQVQVPAGYVADLHSHDHEQFLLVTAGEGRLQCAAGEIELVPGAVIHLAAGAWHSATFTAATVLVEFNLNSK